jgi:hypothetical protein
MADTPVIAQSITVSGANFAADLDGSSVSWPYAKLAFGASGTQTEVASGANALPVSVGNTVSTVSTGGSITVIGVVPISLAAVGHVIVDSGSLGGVTSIGTIANPLPAGTNNLGTVGQSGTWNIAGVTSIGAVNAVTSIGAVNAVTSIGVVNAVTSLGAIVAALPAGGNSIGMTQNIPGTTGGMSRNSFPSAAGLNLTAIKTSAGQAYFISVQNISANPVYLKVFDLAGTVNVTMGTTACDYQFMSPANATASLGTGIALSFDPGILHSNGIIMALTGGIAKADNTSIAASIAIVTVGYK